MKATVLGVRRMSGTSSKSGNAYDMCNIVLAVPVEAVNTPKMQAMGYGYSPMELPCDPAALPDFANLKYPASVTLTTEPRARSGKVETVVTGILKAA